MIWMTAHHGCSCPLQECSEEDYFTIVNGWKTKLERAISGDQRWGLFYATRDWVIALRFERIIKENRECSFIIHVLSLTCLKKNIVKKLTRKHAVFFKWETVQCDEINKYKKCVCIYITLVTVKKKKAKRCNQITDAFIKLRILAGFHFQKNILTKERCTMHICTRYKLPFRIQVRSTNSSLLRVPNTRLRTTGTGLLLCSAALMDQSPGAREGNTDTGLL